MSTPRPRGNYGIDAPWVPWLWVGIAAVYAAFTIVMTAIGVMTAVGAVILWVLVAGFLAGAALYWHATLRGKFAVWRETLADTPAPRRALDMGCGRGAVAIMVADTYPEARVDGVDLWRGIDQSGNSPAAATANAGENGVADRIRFTTGDMTALPFEDAVFDLVTAGLSIHNIHSFEGRRTAVEEAWRVLRPGGRLIIVDISKTREYEQTLVALGAADLTATSGGWRVWWSGPWMATRILTATKPAEG